MARPKIDYPPAAQLRLLADDEGRLALRVTPGAKTDGIAIKDGQVLVRTRARPQDGAANEAVIAMLASALGCAPSHIALLRGATSRLKLVRIEG